MLGVVQVRTMMIDLIASILSLIMAQGRLTRRTDYSLNLFFVVEVRLRVRMWRVSG